MQQATSGCFSALKKDVSPLFTAYTPPELIVEGKLTPSADVYAFGILMWEIYTSSQAYQGVNPAQVRGGIWDRCRVSCMLIRALSGLGKNPFSSLQSVTLSAHVPHTDAFISFAESKTYRTPCHLTSS